MPYAELFSLPRELVLPLHDAHVTIDAGDTGRFGQSRPGTTPPGPGLDLSAQHFVEQHDLAGRRLRTFANGRIGYAGLPDGTGYLRISGFGGYDATSPAYARTGKQRPGRSRSPHPPPSGTRAALARPVPVHRPGRGTHRR
ncbi:hypothetical protein ACFYMW_10935 [Streptomyces sp. NPDC006692]|uniref:hypothetical protein n=1 Tax=Streptomyces sp. NPDC006692 TaxID=3364758 RepID=UPI0036C16E24